MERHSSATSHPEKILISYIKGKRMLSIYWLDTCRTDNIGYSDVE